ncbi:MAG: YceD family protein [Candidatus Competibacteraceae bacterium]|nr:YceD family protein [Candidatus Competibacteraceae bacterium]
MQTLPFSESLNPWRLAAEGGRLEGVLALGGLRRLAVLLGRTEGVVTVTMVAGIDAQGIHFIVGRFSTVIEMVCQRCLGPLRLPFDLTVRLGLARTEAEADRLPESYEPLLVAESGLVLADWVEDELLLALPQIPRHDDLRECAANGYRAALGESAPDPDRASLSRCWPHCGEIPKIKE